MSEVDNGKRLAVAWLEHISRGDVDAMVKTTGPTWRMHGGPPGLPVGPDGVRTLFAHFGRAVQHWTVEDVIAEGDRVVLRATNRGEQDSFLGLPATGVQQGFSAMFIFRISGGVVHEVWRNADDLSRVLQIGARILPPE